MYISDSDSDNNDSDIEQYDDIELIETISIASSSTDGDDHEEFDDDDSIIIDDMDDYSDSDSDSDNDDALEIYQEDSNHLYMDKIDKNYYIGFCKPMHKPNLILMANSISSNIFFRHSFERIYNYLQHYSTLMLYSPKMEIMQLHITHDEVYSIVIKTHWLRLIQRHWKRIFIARNVILRQRMTPQSLHTFEMTGRFPYGLRTLPGLHGLMESYRIIH